MRKALGVLTLLTSALVAWPSAVAAQPNATIVLASGDHVSGQLVDMNGSGFQMTVNGEEREFPRGDVAVIDFAGGDIPSSEVSRMEGGRTLVFMRGGDYFYGTLYDMGQRDPLQITVQTPDGERQVMSNQVARIYLRNWDGMPSGDNDGNTSGTATQLPGTAGRTVMLPANQQWVMTGIQVRQGQMVVFSAEGEIQLSNDANDRARPGGSVNNRVAGRGAPIASDVAGALLGRIGQNQPFGIGNQTQPLPMPQSGVLLIGINDASLGNNSGQYTVTITPQ